MRISCQKRPEEVILVLLYRKQCQYSSYALLATTVHNVNVLLVDCNQDCN